MNAIFQYVLFPGVRHWRPLLAVLSLFPLTGSLCADDSTKVVYLVGEKGYAILEKAAFPDPTGAGRTYIRSSQAGRFIEKEESANLVDYAHFFRIRESTPFQAGLASLKHFDAGAEYNAALSSQLSVEQANQQSRWIKVALMVLTAATWNAAQLQAHDLARNAYLPTDQTRQNFRLARLAYYGSGLSTIGYFSYVAFHAYSYSGHSADGRDLQIRERIEVSGNEVPGLQAPPDSHLLRSQMHLAVTFPVAFGSRP